MQTISGRIFELLRARNMSQKEFAQKTGIAESSISDWKKKRTNPSSDKILIICEVLGVTPYELLSGVEKEKYTQLDYVIVDKKSADYEFLEFMRSFNKSNRDRLFGYMQALKEMQEK